jgi:drug/metabolite transporter, DME family
LAAALLFSTGGAAIKATTLAAWPVASLRCLIATAALILLVPDARKNWSIRLLPLSLAYAATLLFFVLATKLTTSANAIFLQATAPIYLLALGPWMLKEPVSRRDLALAVAIGVGMALFFFSENSGASAPDPALGNLFGALSGLAWALTVAGLRRYRDSGIAVVAMGNLTGALIALPLALPLAIPSALDLAAVTYLGIFQIGLAYFCLTRGLRQVRAFEASALMLLEPALNPVWTYLLNGERPGGLALAGGAIILAATLAQTLASRSR